MACAEAASPVLASSRLASARCLSSKDWGIEMTEPVHDYSRLFIELGGVAVGLAILARIASRARLSPISLFLLAGLAFGKGGIAPLNMTKEFISLGAEI